MEIIGRGDIAEAIKESIPRDFLFFCAGVSNSEEVRESEYQREKDLLLEQNKFEHIVYFGSLCIFFSTTRYAKHKKEMEELIKKNFKLYTIVRLGNITWGKNNPHTLINFLSNKIRNYEPFEINDVYRYIVDKDEFLHWIDLIPTFSCELNIVGRRMKVKDIVKEYCYPWGKFDGPIESNSENKWINLSQ